MQILCAGLRDKARIRGLLGRGLSTEWNALRCRDQCRRISRGTLLTRPSRKKRKFELGRQPAMTKLDSSKRIHTVRVRGGNTKHRALRLDTGNFAWGSESITRKTRLIQVVSRLPLQSGRNRAGSKEDSRVEI